MSDIRSKRPRVLGARVAGLRLTPEERFIMAQIDGELSVSELVRVTGLDEARVERLVSKLAFEGAVDLADGPPGAGVTIPGVDDGGTTSMADLAAALGMDPSAFAAAEEQPAPAAPKPRPRIQIRRREVPEPAADPLPTPEPVADEAPEESGTQSIAPEASSDGLDEIAGATQDGEPAEEEPSNAVAAEKDDDATRAAAERNYRQIFESRWHELPVDQRVAGARTARGSDLLALCFDPDPRVIAAVLENATCGLDHVRLIAFHHRTGTGLEIVARRQDWLRDILVERRLLRNPMIGEIVLGRVMGPKRLFPTYKIAIDRDIPELSRIKCRGFIRQKWQTAPSEERADLLLRTEGRCLVLMTGCTFDAKTTAILCGRPINSVMFVQSIAKFGSSPPALLAHLFKQPFVRKNAPLKKMLLAHPNMPGDVKRSV